LGFEQLANASTNLKPKWWKIQVSKAVQNHKSLFDKAELVINCGDAGQN
jgi:hypothetical protein